MSARDDLIACLTSSLKDDYPFTYSVIQRAVEERDALAARVEETERARKAERSGRKIAEAAFDTLREAACNVLHLAEQRGDEWIVADVWMIRLRAAVGSGDGDDVEDVRARIATALKMIEAGRLEERHTGFVHVARILRGSDALTRSDPQGATPECSGCAAARVRVEELEAARQERVRVAACAAPSEGVETEGGKA